MNLKRIIAIVYTQKYDEDIQNSTACRIFAVQVCPTLYHFAPTKLKGDGYGLEEERWQCYGSEFHLTFRIICRREGHSLLLQCSFAMPFIFPHYNITHETNYVHLCVLALLSIRNVACVRPRCTLFTHSTVYSPLRRLLR